MNAKERLQKLTPQESSEYATFRTATTGMRSWLIAKAMNHLFPGIDFRGCTKGDMAETWATRMRPGSHSGRFVRLSRDHLVEALKQQTR